MNDKSPKRKLPKDIGKMLKKVRSALKDAGKKLTVHQDPKSKLSASLRSIMDQPRKKKVISPHTDKKKPKYGFKKKT